MIIAETGSGQLLAHQSSQSTRDEDDVIRRTGWSGARHSACVAGVIAAVARLHRGMITSRDNEDNDRWRRDDGDVRVSAVGRPSDDGGFIETAARRPADRSPRRRMYALPAGTIFPRARPVRRGRGRPEGRDAVASRPTHYRRPDDDGGCDGRTEDRHSCPATSLMNGGTERRPTRSIRRRRRLYHSRAPPRA